MARKQNITVGVPKSRKTSQLTTSVLHVPVHNKAKDSELSFGLVLQKYRIKKKISQTKLAEIMGTSRNTITNWETDKSRPEIEAIRELALLLDIPLYELFNINGKSTVSASERILLERYRRLSPLSQSMLSDIALTMVTTEEAERNRYLKEKFGVFKLEATAAAAGTGCLFTDTKPDYLFIKKNRLNVSADSIVRVSGRSMEPNYYDGDLVYIKYQSSADDGSIVVCSTPDGAVIKRMLNHKLYSLNPDYPFGERCEDDHIVILGRVLGIVAEDDLPADEDIETLEEVHLYEISKFKDEYGIDF